MSDFEHWANDRYWTDALESLPRIRNAGSIQLDVARIQQAAFHADGPAYKLMEAMVSVWQEEGNEGFRGAPRILMALLVKLSELSDTEDVEST